MPSDYAAIRADHVRQYGEGTRHLAFLGKLYADRTHFIFELLQNAEDAGASVITFDLAAAHLEVRHNGRPFTRDDVVGICGVDVSTKADDLMAIGKFGIGFKSVYAYTTTPEVHSGGEHFRIEHYVRPHATPPRAIPDWQTLFVFPFNRDDVPQFTAYEEISVALQSLDPVTLLFLHEIQEIDIRLAGAAPERLRRLASDVGEHIVDVVHERDGRVIAHPSWLRFSQPLASLGRPRQYVEIAWRRSSAARDARVERVVSAPLVAFFPTDRSTELGFLLQAPFRTTPARDNIAEQDDWNRQLLTEAARLLVDTLTALANEHRLTVDVLQALPLDADYFPPGALLRPMLDALTEAFVERPLLPLHTGGYAAAPFVRLARGGGLRELLPAPLLTTLAGSPQRIDWLPDSITQNRTQTLWSYLRNTVGVEELTPDWLVGQLSADFLRAAADSWLIQLYGFLHQNQALWRASAAQWDTAGPARQRPIIRLDDGSMVAPSDSSNRPLAYLPGPIATSFPTVARALADNPTARAFLQALGLNEPDVAAEVLETILPIYTATTAQLTTDQRAKHLDTIARALTEAAGTALKRLSEELRKTAFLLATDSTGKAHEYCRPEQAYWSTDDLRYYFAADVRPRFLNDWYGAWRDTLTELGVTDQVRVRCRQVDSLGHVALASQWGHHQRGLNGFDPGFDIDGLGTALAQPDERRSRYVWNHILVPNAARIRGAVETAGRQDYSNANRVKRLSLAGREVTTRAWLPAPTGGFTTPDKLEPGQLPAGFESSPALLTALGMTSEVVEEASQQLGVPSELLRYLAQSADAQKVLKQLAARNRRDEELPRNPPEGLSFADAVRNSFARPDANVSQDVAHVASGEVTNSALRRRRSQESIVAAQDLEPAREERFAQSPRRVWEHKDSAVRHFLLEQYNGRCQVCTDTFLKRDGTPYFEGLHFVPYTYAAWTDRPGGVICLCATCCSMFLHGTVEADDVVEQVLRWRPRVEDGSAAELRLVLCGESVRVHYTEKHLLDLQTMLQMTVDDGDVEDSDEARLVF